jgi:hypothetical protein
MYFSDSTEGVGIKVNPLQTLLIVLGCGILLVLGLMPQLVYSVL